MNGQNIEFPSIFDHIQKIIPDIQTEEDCQIFADYRKQLYAYNKSWQNANIVKTSFDDFTIDIQHSRYSVDLDGINYEILFLPSASQSKNLYINFCGGRSETKIYPMFLRWKYTNFFDGHYVCIEDPMYSLYPAGHVWWYYGTKIRWYLQDVAKIIEKFTQFFSLTSQDLILCGNSGGGTAAIHLANIFEGATCYAMNPQFNLADWDPKITQDFYDKFNIDLNSADQFDRHFFTIKSSKSLYFFIHNMASSKDRIQFIKFFQKNSIPIRYGINQYHNIITWFHHTDSKNKHISYPTQLEFFILELLRKSIVKNHSIDYFLNFSYFLNEYLNDKYVYLKKISDQDKSIKMLFQKFNILFSNFISQKYPELSLITEIYTQGKIEFSIQNCHNFYYRILFGKDKKYYIYFISQLSDKIYLDFISSLLQFLPNNSKLIIKNTIYIRLEILIERYDIIISEFIDNTLTKTINFSNNLDQQNSCGDSPHG